MLRIIHVVGTMDLGGVETLLMNLYRFIDKEVIQFDFLCHHTTEAAYTSEIRALGGRLFCIPGLSECSIFEYERNLYNFFRDHPEYSIVHSHMNDRNGIILKQAFRAGVPNRFSHIHTLFRNQPLINQARIAIFKKPLNKFTTKAFACSADAGKQLYNRRLQESLVIIHNGIDSERFRFNCKTRERIKNSIGIGEEPVIGHVGRFAEVKNHMFLLECFKAFTAQYRDAKLILIGTGKLENRLKERSNALGISNNVLFLGNRNDVNEVLQAMDVFVFPSITEGLPVSVIEAQASGLQLLTSDTVSEESVLTNLVSRLSLTQSPETWAQRMSELYIASKENDRTVYPEEIANRGYDAKTVASDITEIYLEAVNDK